MPTIFWHLHSYGEYRMNQLSYMFHYYPIILQLQVSPCADGDDVVFRSRPVVAKILSVIFHNLVACCVFCYFV